MDSPINPTITFSGPLLQRGLFEGREWVRDVCDGVPVGEWRRAEDHGTEPPVAEPSTHTLYLARQKLDDEEAHWLLTLVPKDNWPKAVCHQVKAIPTGLGYFNGIVDIRRSFSFHDTILLGELDHNGPEVLADVVAEIPAPSTEDGDPMQGNCQTWVYWVVDKLVKMDLIDGEQLRALLDMMEPNAKRYMRAAGIQID